jgi:hypothetical protein
MALPSFELTPFGDVTIVKNHPIFTVLGIQDIRYIPLNALHRRR